ncbi:MAG: hypothetical protein HY360_07500 [Verrucomicrobia bacterium]|nr:hypothetical protein [Verrucomicrobiota bacterium]
MQAKRKFPCADALAIVRALLPFLQPHCQRLIVAGSLRRRKSEVGDIEILYIPKFGKVSDPGDLFDSPIEMNEMDRVLDQLLADGIIAKRLNVKDSTTWGNQNKLATHQYSGIPVDLFATNEICWHNDLVCRTGGAQSNIQIAQAAQARGWQWKPYSPGFSRQCGLDVEVHKVLNEQEVFNFVNLPYLEPWERR